MNNQQIIQTLKQCNALLDGHFLLSSGLHSRQYVQCAQVMARPDVAQVLCAQLVKKIDVEIDLVVAPAMGGVVVGYEVARQLNKPTIFCERVDGNFTFRRGFSIKPGQKILIVEDVVTTAKSSFETLETIKAHGGDVVAEACLIDRSAGKHNLPYPLFSLLELEIETFDKDSIPDDLVNVPAIKPGSRDLKK